MKIRPGRVLSVLIVSSWLVLLGNHALKSYSIAYPTPLVDLGPDSSRDAELTQRGVFYRGARIGFIRERFTPLANGFRAEQTGELTLNLLGRERRVRMEGARGERSQGRAAELFVPALHLLAPFSFRDYGHGRGDRATSCCSRSGPEARRSGSSGESWSTPSCSR